MHEQFERRRHKHGGWHSLEGRRARLIDHGRAFEVQCRVVEKAAEFTLDVGIGAQRHRTVDEADFSVGGGARRAAVRYRLRDDYHVGESEARGGFVRARADVRASLRQHFLEALHEAALELEEFGEACLHCWRQCT